jgi:hypothetical protein
LTVNANEVTVNGSTGGNTLGTTITIAQNGSGTGSFTLGQTGGMSGLITLRCSGLPAGLSCTVSPASIEASKLPVPVTVNVSVAQTPSALALNRRSGHQLPWAFGLTLPCGLLMLTGMREGGRKRILAGLVVITLVIVLMLAMSGCGGSSPTPGEKPLAETYTGTITIAPESGATKALSFSVTVNK